MQEPAENGCKNTDFRKFCPRQREKVATRPLTLTRRVGLHWRQGGGPWTRRIATGAVRQEHGRGFGQVIHGEVGPSWDCGL